MPAHVLNNSDYIKTIINYYVQYDTGSRHANYCSRNLAEIIRCKESNNSDSPFFQKSAETIQNYFYRSVTRSLVPDPSIYVDGMTVIKYAEAYYNKVHQTKLDRLDRSKQLQNKSYRSPD